MNKKASLLLMEILVMILVFALAAAACLGVFTAARQMTAQTRRLDEAVLLARNAAQLLQGGHGLASLETGALTLEITELPSQIPGMNMARIEVFYGEEPVFSLNTGWQEVAS